MFNGGSGGTNGPGTGSGGGGGGGYSTARVSPVGAAEINDYQLVAGHLDPRVPPGDIGIVEDHRRGAAVAAECRGQRAHPVADDAGVAVVEAQPDFRNGKSPHGTGRPGTACHQGTVIHHGKSPDPAVDHHDGCPGDFVRRPDRRRVAHDERVDNPVWRARPAPGKYGTRPRAYPRRRSRLRSQAAWPEPSPPRTATRQTGRRDPAPSDGRPQKR